MQRVTHGEGRDIDIPVHNFSETHYTASTFVDATYNGQACTASNGRFGQGHNRAWFTSPTHRVGMNGVEASPGGAGGLLGAHPRRG